MLKRDLRAAGLNRRQKGDLYNVKIMYLHYRMFQYQYKFLISSDHNGNIDGYV